MQSFQLDPYYTMALDEYFLNQTESGQMTGILRLFTWQPGSISIGYFFKKSYLNLIRIQNDQMKVVRRLTGGNAVFQNDQLTYSLILRKGLYQLSDKLEYYLFVSHILKDALDQLGLQCHINCQTKINKMSQVCFNSISQYEITDLKGNKIIGSAQKWLKYAMLQHGSLFLSYHSKDILPYIAGAEDRTKTYSLPSIKRDDLFSTFKYAFSSRFDLLPYQFNLETQEQIKHMVQTKYANDEWNYQR